MTPSNGFANFVSQQTNAIYGIHCLVQLALKILIHVCNQCKTVDFQTSKCIFVHTPAGKSLLVLLAGT